MKIYIGSDHAGFELKEVLIKYLQSLGHEAEDKGAFKYDPEDDYPDFIFPVARAVSESQGSLGIVIGGSGEGEAMAANRIKGVRATAFYGGSFDILKISREHNNSNILSLGARFMDDETAKRAVDVWLGSDFQGGRHERRIEKLDRI